MVATDDDGGGRDAYRLVVRFGERILEAGFTSAPNLFLMHYQALGLSDAEAMWIIQVLRYKWTAEDPYPQQRHLPMSASDKSRRRYTHKLREMGLLFTRRRYYTADSAPRPDLAGKLQSLEYDLSSLFHNLVRLAEWLEAGRAAADFVIELPREVVDKVVPAPATGRAYFHDVPPAIYRRCLDHVAADAGGAAPLLLGPEPAALATIAPAGDESPDKMTAAPAVLPGQNGLVDPGSLPAPNGSVEPGALPVQNEGVEAASTSPKATGSFWGRQEEDTVKEKETAMLFAAACLPLAEARPADLVDLLRGLGAHEPKLSQVLAGGPDPADVWAWVVYARQQPTLTNPAGFVLHQLESRHPAPAAVLALARLGPAEWAWLVEHAPARVQTGGWPANGPVALGEDVAGQVADVAEAWLAYCYNVRAPGALPGQEGPEPAASVPVTDLPPDAVPLDELWAAALGQLQIQVAPADYAAWLAGTRLGQRAGCQGPAWVLVARDTDAREWLTWRLAGLIRKTLMGLVEPGTALGLEIEVAG